MSMEWRFHVLDRVVIDMKVVSFGPLTLGFLHRKYSGSVGSFPYTLGRNPLAVAPALYSLWPSA